MSEICKSLKAKPLLAFIYLLLWPPFLLLATYSSHEPVVFGLWSQRLFQAILVAGALLLVITMIVAFAIFGTFATHASMRLLTWLRGHRTLFALALFCPVLGWLFAIFATIVIVPSPDLETRLSWVLVDLGAVIVLFDLGLLLAYREPKPRRGIQLRLCAVAFGLLLTVGIIEIAGRILPIADQDLWTINPPNRSCRWVNMEFDIDVETNAQGLRSPRLISEDHPGKYRVMVIGDSMTFGHGVQYNEAYPWIAETILHEQYDMKNVEVINVSRSGAGPGEYLEYIRRLGPKFKPNLIVIGYFTGNDCPVRPPFVQRTQEQIEKTREDLLHQDRQHILMSSVTCRLLYGRVLKPLSYWWRGVDAEITPGVRDPFFQTPNIMGTMIASDSLDDEEQQRLEKMKDDGWVDKALQFKVNPWLIVSSIRRPHSVLDMMFMREDTKPYMDREWALCKVILREIIRSAKECSADTAFMIIPHAYQIDKQAVAQLAAWGCVVSPDMIGHRKQSDLVQDFCDEQHVVSINPFDRCRTETENGTQLFFSIDTHLTTDGQRLLGQLLAEKLAEIIPKETSAE